MLVKGNFYNTLIKTRGDSKDPSEKNGGNRPEVLGK